MNRTEEREEERRWTPEQSAAIEGRGNMLVSAGAGSGKTAVMIEKIRRLLMGGASLDQMLIATYTVAAAGDMRCKLATALEKYPEQAEKLPQAYIGTLHSLCSRLIKLRFYLTDADPAFELLAENEAEAMKTAAAETVLGRGGDEVFSTVYDAMLSNRSDKPLKKLLIDLLDFSRTQPDPDAWLAHCLDLYDDDPTVDAAIACMFDAEKSKLLARAQALYVDTAAAGFTRNIAASASLVGFIETGAPPVKTTGRVGEGFVALNERYKTLKGEIEAFRAQVDAVAAMPPASAAKAEAATFVRLARDIGVAYEEMKAQKAALDYADLEHKALEVLEAGAPVPFRYVFVDEYQDVNPLQERIIELLSKNAELFQVGDVKQSIYAFRLCDPDIFLRRFADYKAGRGGTAIELNRNFRSDDGILRAVNRVFDRLMTVDFGGVDYKKDARLICGCGRSSADAVTFTVVGERQKPQLPPVYRVTEDDGGRLSAQAVAVAHDVAKILHEDKDAKPEDIAIIMRSRSPLLYEIAAALSALGIESSVCAKETPAESDAVRPLLNALRLIDNRADDVILAAVLLSPFGGFTVEELTEIGQGESFYAAVQAYDGPLKAKLDKFFETFDRYEQLSYYTPADELAGMVAGEAKYFEYLYAQENGRALAAEAGAFLAMMSASDACASLDAYLAFADRAPAVERVTGPSAVRLMTVHAAKGLEFDYVFFAGTETPFRFDEAGAAATADREYGLCVKRFDDEARAILPTRLTYLAATAKKKRMLEEELRILYVALTRAKKKLFIYGKRAKRYEGEDLKPSCNLNFLLPSFFADARYVDADEAAFERLTRTRILSRPDARLAEEIAGRLRFEYAGQPQPQKTTVTKNAELQDERDYAVTTERTDCERAAEIGTAYHLMMEHIDFARPFDDEWRRLCETFPAESKLCDKDKIGKAAAYVKRLSAGWKLYREKEFVIDDGGVLVQGVIDLLLVNGDRAIVLDYKTTRTEDLLLPAYIYQTDFYARAVERLLGLTVTDVYLYSFYMDKPVKMPFASAVAG